MVARVTPSRDGAGTRLVQRVTVSDADVRAAEGCGAVEKGRRTLTRLAAGLGA